MAMDGQNNGRAGLELGLGLRGNVKQFVGAEEAGFGSGRNAVDVNLGVIVMMDAEAEVGEVGGGKGNLAAQPDVAGVPALSSPWRS